MGDSLRDRLSGLSRGELAGLAVLIVLVVAAGALWYLRSLPEPVSLRAFRGEPAGAVPGPSPSPRAIIVHIAGAVRRPGVYEFVEGDRVIDAVDAAGGATGRASLDGLNLAAPLMDGSQILVPRQVPLGAASEVVPPGGTASGLVNVNTATATELEELPGIGEVLAQAIIDYRTDNGPFTSIDELEDVSGIGPATLEDIRDLVTL